MALNSKQCSAVAFISDLSLACSFADLQNPQMDMDGKACAAVGQSVLMAIYDTLFSQVGVPFLMDFCVKNMIFLHIF